MPEETLELIKEALVKHTCVAIFTPTQQIFDEVLKSISENLNEVKEPLRVSGGWGRYTNSTCISIESGRTFYSPLDFYKGEGWTIIYLNTPKCLKRI